MRMAAAIETRPTIGSLWQSRSNGVQGHSGCHGRTGFIWPRRTHARGREDGTQNSVASSILGPTRVVNEPKTALLSSSAVVRRFVEIIKVPAWVSSLFPMGCRIQRRCASRRRSRVGVVHAVRRARTGRVFPFVIIQEAGLDGFWIDRVLQNEGIESHVVDPASIATSRRHRRAKTDRIDGEALVRALLAYKRGETRVCAM